MPSLYGVWRAACRVGYQSILMSDSNPITEQLKSQESNKSSCVLKSKSYYDQILKSTTVKHGILILAKSAIAPNYKLINSWNGIWISWISITKWWAKLSVEGFKWLIGFQTLFVPHLIEPLMILGVCQKEKINPCAFERSTLKADS